MGTNMVGLRKTTCCAQIFLAAALVTAAPASGAHALVLGSFQFDDNQFGDTLIESDGGAHSALSWLNVNPSDPGNPGYLTGANVDSGIANIGLGSDPLYTIGYNTPIVNGAGADLGIIVARYSTDDVSLDVSIDGVNFLGSITISAATAVSTGVTRSYFLSGIVDQSFDATLFVHSVDLDDFGLAAGQSISAVEVGVGGNSIELDLIRIAGFGQDTTVPEVPEPRTLGLLALGLAGLAIAARRRRAC